MPKHSASAIFEDLHALLHLFRRRLLARLRAQHPELTFTELRLLILTGQEPGVAQKTLIERSHLDKAQMARTLARMQAQGWLQRSTSTQDKRVRCLRLSAQGQALYTQLRAWQEDIAAELLQHWPEPVVQGLQTAIAQAKAADAAAGKPLV